MAGSDCILSSRSEAKAAGALKYNTGLSCVRGHHAQRYTVDCSCVECKQLDSIERNKRSATDPVLLETMRGWHRRSKAKARATEEGKRAHFEANKRYVERNRAKVNAAVSARLKRDPSYRMAVRARSMLHKVLSRTNKRKDARCHVILGYTGDQLKAHIERQFTRGMSWDLVGELIHIDHIIPIAKFLSLGETRPDIINALTNLRPMWAQENIDKRDKVLTLL